MYHAATCESIFGTFRSLLYFKNVFKRLCEIALFSRSCIFSFAFYFCHSVFFGPVPQLARRVHARRSPFLFFFLFLACLHTAFYSQHSHEACGFFGLRLIGHPSYISPFGVSPLTICNLFFFLFHIISISEAFLIFIFILLHLLCHHFPFAEGFSNITTYIPETSPLLLRGHLTSALHFIQGTKTFITRFFSTFAA